eukprot:187443_1
MASYFSSPGRLFSPSSKRSSSSKKSTKLSEIQIEEKKYRKGKINDFLSTEQQLRIDGEQNGIVGDYFRTQRKKEQACINRECLISSRDCCCFFCMKKRRFCGLIIAIILILLFTFILVQLGVINFDD